MASTEIIAAVSIHPDADVTCAECKAPVRQKVTEVRCPRAFPATLLQVQVTSRRDIARYNMHAFSPWCNLRETAVAVRAPNLMPKQNWATTQHQLEARVFQGCGLPVPAAL